MIRRKYFNCICCDKKLIVGDRSNNPERYSVSGGNVEVASCGYGSKFDTDKIIIAICDDCMTSYFNKYPKCREERF